MPDERKRFADELAAGDESGATDRERALLDLTGRLTRTPAGTGAEDVERARAAGLGDREIHDATQVAAYFAYANRIAQGLGADVADETAEPGHS